MILLRSDRVHQSQTRSRWRGSRVFLCQASLGRRRVSRAEHPAGILEVKGGSPAAIAPGSVGCRGFRQAKSAPSSRTSRTGRTGTPIAQNAEQRPLVQIEMDGDAAQVGAVVSQTSAAEMEAELFAFGRAEKSRLWQRRLAIAGIVGVKLTRRYLPALAERIQRRPVQPGTIWKCPPK
jgi:hypothetical protein